LYIYLAAAKRAARIGHNRRMPNAVQRPPFADVLPLDRVEAEWLVVPAFEGDDFADLPGLDAAAGGEIARASGRREATGKPFEIFVTPVTAAWRARRVVLVGAGPRTAFGPDLARRVATTGVLAARQRRVDHVAVALRGGDTPAATPERLAQSVAEGIVLGQVETGRHKNGVPELARLNDVRVATNGREVAGLTSAIDRGRVLAERTNFARDLANEPANVLTPSVLAERAQTAAAAAGLTVEVLDEERIEALGMGLLLGVARGSAEPPRVLVLRHDPPGAPESPVLGLVGKGITFDTGGISIKPADGMDRMKADMAGGAAVIAAMLAIADLQAPTRVVAVVPMTENMPGGRAVKPGDVLRGASGKTVEVLNTDAEGRLILGDGLWYAQQLGATHLVDIATLTGACVVALGKLNSGLFGRPDEFLDAARDLGALTGDRLWPMPSTDDYFEALKSDVADMTNTGGRPGGAVTAAVFLKQFAGELPWLHLDVAGTAWTDDAKPWQVRGATGAVTRLLAELALDPDAWAKAR
jgi:leucyl aminopeptidase